MITPDEALARLKAIAEDDDPENAHADADELAMDILRQHGYGEFADAFDEMEKWYA